MVAKGPARAQQSPEGPERSGGGAPSRLDGEHATGTLRLGGLKAADPSQLARSRADASKYSRPSRATNSATGVTALTAPMPWPEPQMSRQAFAFAPPELSKFIVLTSPWGRLSGSKPALTIERRR